LKRIFILLFLLFAFIQPAFASVIKGTLSAYPDTYVTIYQYTDFIVNNTKQIAQVKTDNKGAFEINGMDMPGTVRLKVIVDNQSVSFYATNGFVYTVKEKDKKLSAEENKAGLNTALRSMEKDFLVLRPLWVDSATSSPVDVKSPGELLRRMDSIKFRYARHAASAPPAIGKGMQKNNNSEITDEEFNNDLDYFSAFTEMFYITFSYAKADKANAIRLFDEMEDKYFIHATVHADNRIYIALLQLYMTQRMNSGYFIRVDNEHHPVAQSLAEADFFKNDSLKELAMLVVTNMLYQDKWYKDEMTLEQFNAKADSLGKRFTIPMFRDYMKQVIVANNKVKAGGDFPVIPLQNIQQEQTDISKIAAPYILIDFWATWCHPCRDAMKEFPALMEKYKGRLMIASISVDNDFKSMKSYLDEQHYTGKWEQLYNGEKGNYYDQIKIDHYPTYYLLDKERKIIAIPDFTEVAETLDKMVK